MSQTTVSAGGQAIGVAGQIADSMEGRDIVSGFNKEPVDQIPFGYGVMRHATVVDGYVLPSGPSGSMEIAGPSVFSLYHNRAGTADPAGNFSGDMGASGLLPNSSMQILRRGRILAPVEATVQNGDRPFCRTVPTGALSRGVWGGTNLGGSYVRDCTNQGIFRSGTYTAADGVTKVAVLDWDGVAKPA